MAVETRVVDDRVFLLGLDGLYRASMKLHERGELLGCARLVAEAIQVLPANVPVEGYYSENEPLTEYFRLIRALQDVDEDKSVLREGGARVPAAAGGHLHSALYGQPIHAGKLLPRGRDPLSQALWDVRPWAVPDLMTAAHRVAVERDDISLVGLAAFVQDPVVLTAVRESVVLYAEMVAMGIEVEPRYRYEWTVGEELARRAARFVDTFNGLFGGRHELPPPDARVCRGVLEREQPHPDRREMCLPRVG